ncbi:MAG: hypothetical protein R2706_02280 [Acidimicrobiales bacterium]
MGSITSHSGEGAGQAGSSAAGPGGFSEPPEPDDASGPAVRAYYERLVEADRPGSESGASTPTTATPDGEAPTTVQPPTATDLLRESINAASPKWVGVMTEGGQEEEIDDFALNVGRQPDLIQVAIGWETDRFDPHLLIGLSIGGRCS